MVCFNYLALVNYDEENICCADLVSYTAALRCKYEDFTAEESAENNTDSKKCRIELAKRCVETSEWEFEWPMKKMLEEEASYSK